jgi:PUA domain protein
MAVSMADIRIKKRKRMREKEVKALSSQLSELFGAEVFTEKDAVDLAESTDFDLIFVNNDILGLIYEEKPFLTVRGILKYRPERCAVTVDMGAVPFVTNGADVMGPGITEADDGISEGDLVWIRDEKNRVPLAVGVALRDSAGIRSKEKGKAIQMLHFVGDKLWKAGE